MSATLTLEVSEKDSASGAPAGLTVIRRTDSSVDISWAAPIDKGFFNGAEAAISEYTVYYSQNSLDGADLSAVPTKESSTTTSISIGNLQGGDGLLLRGCGEKQRRLGRFPHDTKGGPHKNAHHRLSIDPSTSNRRQGGHCNKHYCDGVDTGGCQGQLHDQPPASLMGWNSMPSPV